MTFKKLTLNIHLWLGLASGLVVLIVGFTGCILAFQDEIETYSKPWMFVKQQNHTQVAPSAFEATLTTKLKAKNDTLKAKLLTVQYQGPGKSVIVRYMGDGKKPQRAYMNSYTGAIIHIEQSSFDFFGFIETGHRFLWFPFKIGRPIQGSFVLVFLILMISGIILWWPKRWTKSTRKKSLTLDVKVSPKRLNYDLHNVLGFYMTWVMFFIVVTGLCISMQWFQTGVYWITSGGKQMKEFKPPLSDTTVTGKTFNLAAVDSIWNAHNTQYHAEASLFYILPSEKKSVLLELTNPTPEAGYKRDFKYYDQYTLKDITEKSGRTFYAQATVADKIRRMNVDIHIGAIGGIGTKILAFLASLIAASLPVTGFIIWWGKRNKKTKKKNRKATIKHISHENSKIVITTANS